MKGKNIPKDKFVFLEIRKICQRPQDVVALLEKIFQDIRDLWKTQARMTP